jgi:mitochondrial fission protein ELM1
MSLVMFSQSFGGSIFLAFAETMFSSSLKSELARYAPSVNPEVVIAAGATAIRTVVAKDELAGVFVVILLAPALPHEKIREDSRRFDRSLTYRYK